MSTGYIQLPVEGAMGDIISINGDMSPNQLIVGANGVTVNTVSGTTTITGPIIPASANQFLSNLQSPTAVNQSLLAGTDDTFDIGAFGADRFRNLYMSGQAKVGASSLTLAYAGYSLFGNDNHVVSVVGSSPTFGNGFNGFGTDTGASGANWASVGWGVADGNNDLYSFTFEPLTSYYTSQLRLGRDGNVYIGNSSYNGNLLFNGDGVADIGATSHRPNNLYLAGKAYIPGFLFLGASQLPIQAPEPQSIFLGGGGQSLAGGTQNTSIGANSLDSVSSGNGNFAGGFDSLIFLTSGGNNTGAGSGTLYALIDGFGNSALGVNAGKGVTSSVPIVHGNNNTLIGSFSDAAGDFTNAIALGYQAVAPADNTIQLGNGSITDIYTSGNIHTPAFISFGVDNARIEEPGGAGLFNVFIGANNSGVTGNRNYSLGFSLQSLTTGTFNSAFGASSQSLVDGNFNSSFNVNSLGGNVHGSGNSGFGFQSLNSLTSDNNTGVGYYAGGTIVAGSQNTFLGSSADATGDYTNSMALGYNAKVTASNTIQLGNSSITDIYTSGNYNTSAAFNSASPQTTLTGTAGTAVCSQSFQGSSDKKVTIYLNGYTDTSTQTYTFPTPFAFTPYAYGDSTGVAGATVSTTSITFTVTAETGFVFLEGY